MACDAVTSLAVVGEAEDGYQTLAACEALEPDVVVLDTALPALSGFEVARRLKERGAPPAILMLSASVDDQLVFECMRIGVEGYLGKATGVGQIAEAIETVASGGRVFSPDQEAVAREQLATMARRAREASDLVASLTPREREVLELASQGLTMKQVGTRLGVSPRTVETHIAKLYRKLGVSTRVQAVARAAALGLVDLAKP